MQTCTLVMGAGLVIGIGVGLGAMAAQQPPPGVNYDEAKVPAYTLPDPLTSGDGGKVTSAAAWRERRRGEIVALYERHVYGKVPPKPAGQRFVVRETDGAALGGKVTRKQVSVLLTGREDGPRIELLIYIPARPANARGASGTSRTAGGRRAAPAFLGLNFQGNHAVHADPAILLPQGMTEPGSGASTSPTPSPLGTPHGARGSASSSWPIDLILARGFAVVTAFYGDIELDRSDARNEGVRGTFGLDGKVGAPGSIAPAPGEWGALAAWGWGLSRALDYLATDLDIDASHVAVLGHSRLGKAAVWAGARDERFALVISIQSGEGGVAITRRKFGETIARINDRFPHWFCDHFKAFNGREEVLPVDAHELVALIAPRPVYISSATEDLWADPRGEFLAAVHADPVYRLLGTEGFGVTEMPPPDQSVGKRIGYHLRTGKHEVTPADWEHYLAFATRQFVR